MVAACETSGSVADGEVAWFWRPMVGVKVLMESRGAQPGCEARHQRTDGVNNSNGPRGEHEGSRKTIAWGMPGDSGASAVNTGVHPYSTLCAHQAAGALGTRHPPRPLFDEREGFKAKSRAIHAAELRGMSAVLRDRAAPSDVIVRESGRSSIPETSAMKWIGRGGLDSAMTVSDGSAICRHRTRASDEPIQFLL